MEWTEIAGKVAGVFLLLGVVTLMLLLIAAIPNERKDDE